MHSDYSATPLKNEKLSAGRSGLDEHAVKI